MPLCSIDEAFPGNNNHSNTMSSKPFVTPLTENYLEGFAAGNSTLPEENDKYWYNDGIQLEESLPGSRYSNEGRTNAGYMDLGGLGGSSTRSIPDYMTPVGQHQKRDRLPYAQFKNKLRTFKDSIAEICQLMDSMEESAENEGFCSQGGYMQPRQKSSLNEPFSYSSFMKDLPTYLLGGILVFLLIDVYLRLTSRRR